MGKVDIRYLIFFPKNFVDWHITFSVSILENSRGNIEESRVR